MSLTQERYDEFLRDTCAVSSRFLRKRNNWFNRWRIRRAVTRMFREYGVCTPVHVTTEHGVITVNAGDPILIEVEMPLESISVTLNI